MKIKAIFFIEIKKYIAGITSEFNLWIQLAHFSPRKFHDLGAFDVFLPREMKGRLKCKNIFALCFSLRIETIYNIIGFGIRVESNFVRIYFPLHSSIFINHLVVEMLLFYHYFSSDHHLPLKHFFVVFQTPITFLCFQFNWKAKNGKEVLLVARLPGCRQFISITEEYGNDRTRFTTLHYTGIYCRHQQRYLCPWQRWRYRIIVRRRRRRRNTNRRPLNCKINLYKPWH